MANKSIALKSCFNVILRDFSILKGGWFGILATGVDNLTIDNLKIDTERDGMDIDCCRNVRVSNCSVNSPYDDGICPKSSFALGYARATENVTITNCYVTGAYQVGAMLDGSWKRWAADTKVTSPTGRKYQVRNRVKWRLQEHHDLELHIRRLPRFCAGERRWRAAGGHYVYGHHHARLCQYADLSAPGPSDARAGRGPGGHAQADHHQQCGQLQLRRRDSVVPASSAASSITPSRTSGFTTSTWTIAAEAPPKQAARIPRRTGEDLP